MVVVVVMMIMMVIVKMMMMNVPSKSNLALQKLKNAVTKVKLRFNKLLKYAFTKVKKNTL